MANQTINNETENKNLLLTKYLRKFRPFVSFQRWIATTSLIPNFLKYVFVSSKFKETGNINDSMLDVMKKLYKPSIDVAETAKKLYAMGKRD
mgnify:CR=1 FL=1